MELLQSTYTGRERRHWCESETVKRIYRKLEIRFKCIE